MCGFVLTTNKEKVESMLQTIEHRGTFSQILKQDDYALGHRRLAINGLSPEFNQPYIYKNWIFLFTGEIYNYKSIDPKAKGDIYVLAQLWEKYKEQCVIYVDGMYSFCVYDVNTKLLHIITDILGKKPLYIRQDGNKTLSIASEIKPLCLAQSYEKNTGYYMQIQHRGYATSDETFDKNIYKIPRNIYMVFNKNKQCVLKKELQPLDKSHYFPTQNLNKYLFKFVQTSIKNRLTSDIPISLLLSGGLDSSIIYHFIKKYTDDFTIFHIDNKEEKYLDYLNIPPNIPIIKLPMTNLNNEELLIKILYYNESPIDLGSMIQQYLLGKCIKQHGFNVAISGDGADELFGGYSRMLSSDTQNVDVFFELPYYHLPKLDKLMMAHTIELRNPFLSDSILKFALSLSYNDRKNKSFLKETFKHVLPKQIIERKKQALKNESIIQDKLTWRNRLLNLFQEEVIPKYFQQKGFTK